MLGKRRGLICDLEYKIRHQGEETIDFKLNIEMFSHTYIRTGRYAIVIYQQGSEQNRSKIWTLNYHYI